VVELIAIVVAGTVALLLEVVAGIPAEILLFEVVLEEDTGVCC
jgi:hypothetical protein